MAVKITYYKSVEISLLLYGGWTPTTTTSCLNYLQIGHISAKSGQVRISQAKSGQVQIYYYYYYY